MIKRVVKAILKHGTSLLGGRRANALTCFIAEQVAPVWTVKDPRHKTISFYCPNRTALWRAQSLYEKEPETIRWIDGFSAGDTLLDVGANMGVFSLYAAARDHRVVAVEPESQNYALLNANIYLNKCDEVVHAYNLALADVNRPSRLFLSEFGAANALHTVGQPIDYRHQTMTASFTQGAWEMTLDSFLRGLPDFFPTHIKIDVDGAEGRIIAGAAKTLGDLRLKSVLLELNEELECDLAIIERLKACGLGVVAREHAAIFNTGPFSKAYNYIFVREKRSAV